MSLIRGSNGLFPCNTCLVPQGDQLQILALEKGIWCYPRRTTYEAQQLYLDASELETPTAQEEQYKAQGLRFVLVSKVVSSLCQYFIWAELLLGSRQLRRFSSSLMGQPACSPHWLIRGSFVSSAGSSRQYLIEIEKYCTASRCTVSGMYALIFCANMMVECPSSHDGEI